MEFEHNTGQSSGVGSSLKEDFQQLRKATQKIADQSMSQVRQNLKKGQDKFTEVEQRMEGTIRENPMRALLIALGAGLFLGWLGKRRSS